jgi:DNA-binding GntR family transcriptional regulator
VIHEQTICDQLGVSRTPLREAILQLQSEDLVTVVPNSGTYVSRIDLQAVFDGQLVRDALEMKLVRLAAARVTPGFSAALDASLREQTDAAAAGDHDRFYDLDEAFHAMIAEFAASERVWRIVNSAKAHLDRVRRLSIPIPRHHDVVIAEHGRIARAVASGDADAAAAAMRIHLERVFTMIRRHLDDRREYFAPGSDAVLARHLDAP